MLFLLGSSYIKQHERNLSQKLKLLAWILNWFNKYLPSLLFSKIPFFPVFPFDLRSTFQVMCHPQISHHGSSAGLDVFSAFWSIRLFWTESSMPPSKANWKALVSDNQHICFFILQGQNKMHKVIVWPSFWLS